MQITSSHWGLGLVETDGARITAVRPHPADPDPSPLNDNMAGSLSGPARILRPAVRRGYLDGTGERGADSFIEPPWDEVLDLIADRLRGTIAQHGNSAIFAGSYGWASAGRFHHAQSQLKRVLNCLGGFTRSVGNYSYNAAIGAMPHIVGGAFHDHVAGATRWSVIAQHTDLVVAFGGLPMRNTQLCDGGNALHRTPGSLRACAEAGVQFVNISPLRGDIEDWARPEWMPVKPGSDVALMLALMHVLQTEGLHDQAFLDRYTVGWERFAPYLADKSPEWAAGLTGFAPDAIRSLARRMAQGRTMISVAAGLQRADWGEQPLWAAVTLAAMLGQIGLPGGGYTVGYAVNGHVGTIERPFRWAAFPQGENPVAERIPVAMISEMLLNPGAPYRAQGMDLTLPDVKMVWWAGGNPFHHHQDLNRLRAAFQRPETVIVNELNWTAAARHADIVLPVAAATERTDFGAGHTDNVLVPMPRLTPPPGEARVEYDIYSDLAARLGVEQRFTEGLSSDGWLRRLWAETQETAAAHGQALPDWNSFITGDIVELPDPGPDRVFLSQFRADPMAHPRQTPSGRIELYSDTVAAMQLPECPGHATWVPMRDTDYPLALISGQPKTRLHSQHDTGAYSLSHKIHGREPVLIHPADADPRGITDGDIVEICNDRGRCLAGARVTEDVMQGVVFLWTGAWYDPDLSDPHHRDRHGNPNVLTHDLRTSEWTQSPAAHSALVEVAKLQGTAPPVMAHIPPELCRGSLR